MELPNKMSDLLEVALSDLEKCRSDKDYIIDMDNWHNPSGVGCMVCLAGSVMAKTLKNKCTETIFPFYFPESVDRKLCAIDYFRCGMFWIAISHLGMDNEKVDSVCRLLRETDYSNVDFIGDYEGAVKITKEQIKILRAHEL